MSGEAVHENSGARLIDNSFDFDQKGAATAKERRCRRGGSDQTVLIIEHRLGKVPVTFPAFAVAAQLRIKWSGAYGIREAERRRYCGAGKITLGELSRTK